MPELADPMLSDVRLQLFLLGDPAPNPAPGPTCLHHLLSLLRVAGVVQLCGTVDDPSNLYLVFEPCIGGDLYRRLVNCGLLGEEQLCREVSPT